MQIRRLCWRSLSQRGTSSCPRLGLAHGACNRSKLMRRCVGWCKFHRIPSILDQKVLLNQVILSIFHNFPITALCDIMLYASISCVFKLRCLQHPGHAENCWQPHAIAIDTSMIMLMMVALEWGQFDSCPFQSSPHTWFSDHLEMVSAIIICWGCIEVAAG